MSADIIERVARAINPRAWKAGEYLFSDWQRQAQERAWRQSRAAIAAMRDPTVEMISAFWRQKNCGTQDVGMTGPARSDYDAWSAAIDAALSENRRGTPD